MLRNQEVAAGGHLAIMIAKRGIIHHIYNQEGCAYEESGWRPEGFHKGQDMEMREASI